MFLAVYEQLRLPDSYRSAIERDQCEHCSTHVELLKREAVLSLHSVSIAPFLPKNLVAASKSMNGEQALNSPQSKPRPTDQGVRQTAENMDARKCKLFFVIFNRLLSRVFMLLSVTDCKMVLFLRNSK